MVNRARTEGLRLNCQACGTTVILCDINLELVRAWRSAFQGAHNVEIVHGSITEVGAEAYVSPANAFGIMDGGIDILLSARFPRVEERVQSHIAASGRPLRVGEAVILPTDDFDVPYLVCAPTMHVPSNVSGTENAYLAMFAVLNAIGSFNEEAELPIEAVAVPGLCTGIGGMAPMVAAQQMAEAWRSFTCA